MIVSIFSAYVVTLLKDINHSLLLNYWKIILGSAAYVKNIDANISKPSEKKEIDRHYSHLYWPISIKYTIQWFPFLTIMEHTADIINPDKGIITPLLNVFSMF